MIEELNLCEMGQPSGADRDTYIFNYGKSRDSEIAQEMRINRMTEQARYDLERYETRQAATIIASFRDKARQLHRTAGNLLAEQFLLMYQLTGNERYLDAAIR